MVTDLPIERLLDLPSSPTNQNQQAKPQTGKRRVTRPKCVPHLSGQSVNVSGNRPPEPPSAVKWRSGLDTNQEVIATSDQESKSDEDLEAAFGGQGQMFPSFVKNQSSSGVEHRSSTVYSNNEVSPLLVMYIYYPRTN